MFDWAHSNDFMSVWFNDSDSMPYNSEGSPMVLYKWALTSVDSPGEQQPTDVRPYMARRHACTRLLTCKLLDKQRVLMHRHQGWNVRHGLCHIYMIYVNIWVVYSFCLFCCLFIIVTTQFVALYKPCKPKPKPSIYDPPPRTTTPWQRSKFRYLDRSQSNKYAINMQILTISVSK